MATEREAHPTAKSSFIKFNHTGQRIAGKLFKFGTSDNGDFVVIKELHIKDWQPDAPWQLLDSAAVGLLADIGAKLESQKDVGKYFYIQYVDNEATKRGSMKKLFRVLELTMQEFNDRVRSGARDMRAHYAQMAERGQEVRLFPQSKDETNQTTDFDA